ncbi:MAG: hypothetical protein K2L75_03510, partial [Muribaculaceae bacterium]|nr:hypothetical protein [Muribaculaceae bacterium]
MTEEYRIKTMLDLVGSVKSNVLQSYRDTLLLSEGLQECEAKSPNKPPFGLNYLEYYYSSDPMTSWIIRNLYAYTYYGHHPFFESFAKTFLTKIGFNPEMIVAPIIDKDHEYKSIDILALMYI